MSENLEDFLDHLTEEDLKDFMPDELPVMEDELAKKRILESTLQKMGIQKKRRFPRKTAAAVVVLCLLTVGVVGVKPIQAALEKFLYLLPGIGIVQNGEKEIFTGNILCGKVEEGNKTAELTDVYCINGICKASVTVTDYSSYKNEEENDYYTEMQETYGLTMYHNGTEKRLKDWNSPHAWGREEPSYHLYGRELEYPLEFPLQNNYFEISVDGFSKRLAYQLAPSESFENLTDIGATVEKNGTTITATAEMIEGGVKVEYYVIPSKEVQIASEATKRFFLMSMPYHMDMENHFYLKTKDGRKLRSVNRKGKTYTLPKEGNARSSFFEVEEKDFPAVLHFGAITGTTEESHTASIPVPKINETLSVDIPIKFKYGMVHILEVSRKKTMEQTGEMIKDPKTGKEVEADRIEAEEISCKIQVVPNNTQREMYGVYCRLTDDNDCFSSGYKEAEETDYHYFNQFFTMREITKDSLDIVFEFPCYWVWGDYDIPLELK